MTMLGKILLVEDDPDVAHLVMTTLREVNFECHWVADGLAAIPLGQSGSFDLVLLDLSLPGLDGFDVCRELKTAIPDLPVIMLSARAQEVDVVTGLELGADDYIPKPFRARELLARVRVRIRDTTRKRIAELTTPNKAGEEISQSESARIVIGELEIDLERLRVTKRGTPIELTAKEFEVIALLASNAGRPFDREELLREVWQFSTSDYAVNVSVMMSRIRRKLEDDPENPEYLLTVRGVGYRFVEAGEWRKGRGEER